MLHNGNAVAEGRLSALKDEYGNSSISVPYSNEAYDLLKNYKPIRRDNSLVVNLVGEKGLYKRVMSELLKSSVSFDYIKYDQMSLNDLFIRLLGE